MSLPPIRPFADERVQHKTAVLNGHTYHYLYATPPSGKWSDTVFLVRLGPSPPPYHVTYMTPGFCSILKKRPPNGSTNALRHPFQSSMATRS